MKKILFTSFILFSTYSFTIGQTWDSLGSGLGGISCGGYSIWASCMTVYNGNLYAGGATTLSSGSETINNIAKWNGISWDSLSDGIPDCGNFLTSLVVYNNKLYAGGFIDSAGHATCKGIAAWNDTIWTPLGKGTRGPIGPTVDALCTYSGNLYAGGSFDSAGNVATKYIAMWNGSLWSAVGGLQNSKYHIPGVFSFYNYSGLLYVGGQFDSAGGKLANSIAIWNGTAWSTLGSGINGSVSSICNYNGNIYVAGLFDSAGGQSANNIAEWTGTSWSALGKGLSVGGVFPSTSLAVYNGLLYVGGNFDSAGGIPSYGIATWNGTNWVPMPQQLSVIDNIAYPGAFALQVFNNNLYVAGAFDSAGGIPANNIAVLTAPLGVNQVYNDTFVKVCPNPSSGLFTFQLSGVNEKTEIEVYNMLGENTYDAIINSISTKIDLSNQPTGIYLYRVVSEKGEQIYTGKLTIQK